MPWSPEGDRGSTAYDQWHQPSVGCPPYLRQSRLHATVGSACICKQPDVAPAVSDHLDDLLPGRNRRPAPIDPHAVAQASSCLLQHAREESIVPNRSGHQLGWRIAECAQASWLVGVPRVVDQRSRRALDQPRQPLERRIPADASGSPARIDPGDERGIRDRDQGSGEWLTPGIVCRHAGKGNAATEAWAAAHGEPETELASAGSHATRRLAASANFKRSNRSAIENHPVIPFQGMVRCCWRPDWRVVTRGQERSRLLGVDAAWDCLFSAKDFALRQQVKRAAWWVLASTTGWAVGMPIGGMLGWPVLGAAYGSITGSVLVRLMWQPSRSR